MIPGIHVFHKMSNAENILNSQVIPREELLQIRKNEGKLISELMEMSHASFEKSTMLLNQLKQAVQ
ncbi:MAG TPA: hypothetical protein PK734_08305 [Bacteroidales bacterium]|nr:MAG: hypothetical protein BWY22_01403 [Bacteroidetes bacterium ADurb.Bin217]HPM13480.1 hypothetical protein [Bacteroidales bacterium]